MAFARAAAAVLLVFFLSATPVRAVTPPVIAVAPDAGSMDWGAANDVGESQSTVVPPGLKKECPAGSLLITNDWIRPGQGDVQGVVAYRDLGASGTNAPGATAYATFKERTDPTEYSYGQDHQLATLPNGDVLYYAAGASKKDIWDAKRPWWAWWPDRTSRKDFTKNPVTVAFGPRARSNLQIWRSTDCGRNFQFSAEIDTAGDWKWPANSKFRGVDRTSTLGFCGYPQLEEGKLDKSPNSDFDMGGSDGPWVGLDAKGRLVSVQECVGYYAPDPGKYLTTPINVSAVHTSADGGTTWDFRGFIEGVGWRPQSVITSSGRFLTTQWGTIGAGTMKDGAQVVIDQYITPKTLKTGWWPSFCKNSEFFDITGVIPPADGSAPKKLADAACNEIKYADWRFKKLYTNIHYIAQMTRWGDGALVAYPEEPSDGVYAYDVYALSKDNKFKLMTSITPSVPGKASIIFHPTFIDPGTGPVLLYWMDVDGAANQFVVRGKLFYPNGQMSTTFAISRKAGSDASYVLQGAGAGTKWYGDYNTGGGFAVAPPPPASAISVAAKATPLGKTNFPSVDKAGGVTKTVQDLLRPRSSEGVNEYRYFPVWPKVSGGMGFAEVWVSVPYDKGKPGSPFDVVKATREPIIKKGDWVIEARPIDPAGPVETPAVSVTKVVVPEWAKQMSEEHEEGLTKRLAQTKAFRAK